MLRIRLCSFLCLLLFLLLACVSKNKYLQMEGNLSEVEQRLEQQNRTLENLNLRLAYTEESRDKCMDSLSDFQARHKDLQNENSGLSRSLGDLRADLDKRESTIEEQTRIIRKLNETREKIEKSMREQIEAQEIKLEEIEGKLKVTFLDKILFDTGSVEINMKGKKALLELADSLRENRDQRIVVEGHTDNVPIGSALLEKYPTNWELSAARATVIVRFLQEAGLLEPERLSACAYSHYRPVGSNKTEVGRSKNRRIEIILAPMH